MKTLEKRGTSRLFDEMKSPCGNGAEELERTPGTPDGLHETVRKSEWDLECRVREEVEKRLAKERLLLLTCIRESTEELTGNIAHQWRQPLNIIGLGAQRLQFDFARGEVDDTYLDELVRDFMDIVKQMSRTVRHFRNFLQTDREKRDFSIGETVRRVLSFVEGSMKSAGVSLRLEEHGEDYILTGYPNELSLIILNIMNKSRKVLVGKRVENPFITVGFFPRGEGSVITIHDNGGQIPQQLVGRVFEPYSTVGTRGAGTGMELYLAKLMVEQKMGGTMTAVNRGDGLEFRIELQGYSERESR